MKCFLKIFLVFLFFFLNVGKSYSEDKISYINLEMVLQDSIYGKKIIKQLNTVNASNITSLKNLESDLKLQEDEIKKKQNIISKDEYNKEIFYTKSYFYSVVKILNTDYNKNHKDPLVHFIIRSYIQID